MAPSRAGRNSPLDPYGLPTWRESGSRVQAIHASNSSSAASESLREENTQAIRIAVERFAASSAPALGENGTSVDPVIMSSRTPSAQDTLRRLRDSSGWLTGELPSRSRVNREQQELYYIE